MKLFAIIAISLDIQLVIADTNKKVDIKKVDIKKVDIKKEDINKADINKADIKKKKLNAIIAVIKCEK